MSKVELRISASMDSKISTTDDEVLPLIVASNDSGKTMAKESSSSRLISLDVFRGMTIFLMNLVNNADGSYWIFEHAPWNGLTLADFVMPFFLFIVGCSIVLSHSKLRTRQTKLQIFQKSGIRALKLIGLGLALYALDNLPNLDLYKYRLPGVLQRIAFGYIITVAVELFVPKFGIEEEGLEHGYVPPESGKIEALIYSVSRGHLKIVMRYSLQWLCGVTLFLLYLSLALGVYVPGCGRGDLSPACNAFGYIDTQVFHESHLYGDPTCLHSVPPCRHFDPEGLLSTIMSVNSVLIGLYFGYVLVHFNRPKDVILQWVVPSTIFMFVGLMIHFFGGFPLNKNLYTPSFLFVMAGAAGYILTLYYLIVDVYGFKKPFMPFVWLGSNAIIIYVLDSATPDILAWFYYKDPENNIVDLPKTWLKRGDHLGESGGQLFWAFSDTIFWTCIAGVLYYKKIFFKV